MSNIVMTKHEVVMLLAPFQKENAPSINFVPAEGDNPIFPHEDYGMNRNDWNDMGQPAVITITIEPGDKLQRRT